MFYLTPHSTHFIYGYMASNMVKDHSDSETRNSLPPHGLLFPIIYTKETPASMAQCLNRRPKGHQELRSQLGTGFNPGRDFKGTMGILKATSFFFFLHRCNKMLGGPWTRNSDLPRPKPMVSFWLGTPGPSGPLDIVHPVHCSDYENIVLK